MNLIAPMRRTAETTRRRVIARRNLLTLPGFLNQDDGQSVYFLTPDHDRPAGGVRVIYRHVDLLNRAGINAAVLHQRPGFRCGWFENDTRIRDVRHTRLGDRDLLVVGELNVGSLSDASVPYPHIVFNQNSFLTWSGHLDRVADYYGRGPAPAAVLTVSEYARAFLARTFPDLPVRRLHLQIDEAFSVSESPRERVITYMPRKGAADQALLLRRLAEGMGLAAGWRFEPLDGLHLEQVAAKLKRSQIFLSFADHEGFGLPAAEAMACGNFVIGSHGYGGREFFDPQFCSPVEVGDVLGMALSLQAALDCEAQAPGWLLERGRRASKSVTRTYSKEAEERDVVSEYSGLLRTLA